MENAFKLRTQQIFVMQATKRLIGFLYDFKSENTHSN